MQMCCEHALQLCRAEKEAEKEKAKQEKEAEKEKAKQEKEAEKEKVKQEKEAARKEKEVDTLCCSAQVACKLVSSHCNSNVESV